MSTMTSESQKMSTAFKIGVAIAVAIGFVALVKISNWAGEWKWGLLIAGIFAFFYGIAKKKDSFSEAGFLFAAAGGILILASWLSTLFTILAVGVVIAAIVVIIYLIMSDD